MLKRKKTRVLISFLLALVLMFCTISAVSAKLNESGTRNSESVAIAETTARGTVTAYSNRAFGQTTVGSAITKIKVQVCLNYSTPATPNFYAHSTSAEVESPGLVIGTNTPTIDTSIYTARVAYAGHDAIWGNTSKHFETRDYL